MTWFKNGVSPTSFAGWSRVTTGTLIGVFWIFLFTSHLAACSLFGNSTITCNYLWKMLQAFYFEYVY